MEVNLLSNNRILGAWEKALNRHPVDRTLVLLQEFFPESSWDELAKMSLGERNEHVLEVREKNFGKEFHGSTYCKECYEPLEFVADSEELRGHSVEKKEDYNLEWEGYRFRLRLLNSLDLAAVEGCGDVQSGRRLLAQRVILDFSHEVVNVPLERLPAQAINAISESLEKFDPQASMTVHLHCPACKVSLVIPLDVGDFLWKEISAQAKRLLREVKILARYFGWREQDILSMTSLRRHNFLTMVEN